jgi:UDP-GlcNAc:undecaprenyl-phosphate GlcNAc-1-phosphate transferase
MILPILLYGASSLLISFFATWALIYLAPRIGFVDAPGHRKIHSAPKPLGGGIAIFWGFAIPVVVALALINSSRFNPHDFTVTEYTTGTVTPADPVKAAYWDGVKLRTPLALTLLGASLFLHLVGLWDDRRPLGPWVKLIAQLIAASALVLFFPEMRALTVLGTVASAAVSILWIVAVTNAFNFLDNMDGLSAGVAAVCTTSFLVTAIIIEQWFVAATLVLLLGAVLGFLFWNFPPAKIFMGDGGSLVIGFILGALTVRTTWLLPGQQLAAGWYSVFAPLIVLAVPLYDLVVVSMIRLAHGQSPFVGDTNHFSHRLVARGMSRRTAVLCIYLVTAATAIAAILLPHVQSTLGAMLIFGQTVLVLGVVALLEQHPLSRSGSESKDAR